MFHDDAKMAMFAGVEKIAKAVRVTMGPKGRNVVFERSYGAPVITNDGVTIAKEVELEDKLENMGAQLLKEAATKTNDVAGDGTTTATVLAHAMVKEGLRNVAAGANPMEMKKGIERAVAKVNDFLTEHAKEITSKEEIAQVATISAQSPEVGELIAEVMDLVGKDGVITIEEGQTFGLNKKVVEGMQFDNGYISPYMITDSARMEASYDDVKILVTDKKIGSIHDLLPLLEKLAQMGKKNLVIIAEDIEGEALATLVLNKIRGTFNTLAVKAPGFGDRRKEMLKDIAALTGATVISEEVGLKLDAADVEHLGEAKRIVSSKDTTVIVDGAGSKEAIDSRITSIKAQIDNASSDFDKEKLMERLAKLAGGVAIIEVGAATEVELKEKKHRIEDALAATRAAVEEGIVAGGGTALLKAAKAVDSMHADSEDEKVGIKLVRTALEYPARQIAFNCGVEGSVVVDKVMAEESVTVGYNAAKDEIVDLVKEGILDPKKVTRSALQNAASVAAMFLTTEAAIHEIPKEDKGGDMPAGMGGGMGGMPGMGMM